MKMTKEEAIRYCDEYLERHIADIDKEFLKIAKEALQQKPCTDAISRQAVLEELPRRTMKNYFGEVVGDVVYIDDIKTLPPVTPQPKMGHWIMRHYIDKERHGFNMWVCSECYKEYSYDAETGVGITDANYCPNCGAKMKEVEDNG